MFGGGFGDIFRGTYQGAVVAVKRIRIFQTDTDLPKKRRKFCQEALTWQSLKHAYIVPFLGIVGEEFPTALCMVSPWMRHGTVLKHLADNGRASVNKRLYEISQGLEYLHSQHIVHGDLRGCNILINDSWQACLTDFGLTVFHDATPATSTSRHEGSVRWMAPELHMPSKFAMARFRRTPASDIYAFGCVCLELYTGRAPFHDIVHETQIILEVIEGQRPDRPTYTDPILSDALWQLVQACWSGKSSDRPATSDVVSILKELSQPPLRALPMLEVPIPGSSSVVEFDGDVPQIMGLTTKDEALPGISFRPMDKARARPREEESEDDIGNRPTKKVKGKGKAPAEGEKKFRLSEVQTVIREDSRREV
ncbi:kinase-like protein [Hymenopellis radicata]|nr:kinase-like protein [Hymenopellis radicata]